jgi:hypothetical protein
VAHYQRNHWLTISGIFIYTVKDELIEYHKFIDILLYLNEVLKETNTQIPYWKKFSETLLFKICFHGISIHNIISGFELNSIFISEINNHKIVDRASSIVILRSQLEAFLMYRHLYVNTKNDDEKELRYLAWILASLKLRQTFPENTLVGKKKKADERVEIDKIQNRISGLNAFTELTKKQQLSIFEAGSSKLFKHWSTIMVESGYNENHIFSIDYKYWSTYAHSEGLSIMQLHDSSFYKKENDTSIIADIHSSKLIIASMIIFLSNDFDEVGSRFNTLEPELQFDIEYFYNLSLISHL